MTVISIGPPITKETTCHKCRSFLQYEFTDMIVSVERDYTGSADNVARITCPVCSTLTAVPTRF